MPDPRDLKVGDRVHFISEPEEWSQPGNWIHRDTRAFMRRMIKRKFPSRICGIDEFGHPWIQARIKRWGRTEHHSWNIIESTGWRKVHPRKRA